jgi:hypothetical protein
MKVLFLIFPIIAYAVEPNPDLTVQCVRTHAWDLRSIACRGVETKDHVASVGKCIENLFAKDQAAVACQGVQTLVEATAVSDCSNKLQSIQGKACRGVKNDIQGKAVVKCVEGIIQPTQFETCLGVISDAEAEAVIYCALHLKNNSFLSCQNVKTKEQANLVISCDQRVYLREPHACAFFSNLTKP